MRTVFLKWPSHAKSQTTSTPTGMEKRLGGDSWPKQTKGRFRTLWCQTRQEKLRERRGEEGPSCLWCLSSQETVMHAEALLSGKWLDICLPMGSSELLNVFYLLAWTAFAFPIKLPLSLSMSLLAFLIFSPHPMREGRDQAAGWGLACWAGSTGHRDNKHMFFLLNLQPSLAQGASRSPWKVS